MNNERESKDLHELANEHVIKTEINWWIDTANELDRLQHSNCDCEYCGYWGQLKLKDDLADEEDRLIFVPEQDHEEELLGDWELRTKLNRFLGEEYQDDPSITWEDRE